jgi:hypothetical protein
MSIHFIGSDRGQAGKSWFIRALVEVLARTDERIIVVDASSDKRIGTTYSPTFNRAFDLQFSTQAIYDLDLLLDLGLEHTVVVKIPANDKQVFIRWARETEIRSLGFPCFYWFVSTGKEDYPSEILDLFGQQAFLVENHHFCENFKTFEQPDFDETRRVILLGMIRNPQEIYQIENSQQPLAHFLNDSKISLLTRTRIYRLIKGVAEGIELISTHSSHRDRMSHYAGHSA